MISFDVARVVLSGTFRRDHTGLRRAYQELIETNCLVLSPHTLDFSKGEFVRDPAEAAISVEAIEQHHLMSIEQADFMWVHAPDGYVGVSAAMEIGYAYAMKTPIFSRSELGDELLSHYVRRCNSVFEAKCLVLGRE